MDRKKRYCMGCMSPMEGEGPVCPICSHDNSIDNPKGTLPAGTVLEEKYLVGKALSQNDLTIVYIGLDLQRGRRVFVEEFMPRAYADRSGDHIAVITAEENRTRYKTLLSDIADRWKRVGGIDHKCLVKIRELLLINNTAYCISSYIAFVSLEKYLEEKGPLDWGDTKNLFLPLLSLVSNLHNRGIVHCGISPDNIVVDRKGGLRLMGFSLPELRTVGSGLSPQLYDGYSAPEQYSKSLWQGEWTDIYSLGALLYRALTGQDPMPATQRMKADGLPDVAALRPLVPAYVSDAVRKAMELNKKDRFRSVDEFTAALLEEIGSNTTVFRPEPPAAKPATRETKAPHADRSRYFLAGLAVSLALNVVLGVGWLTAEPEEEPIPESESSEAVTVMEYDFTGEYWPMLQEQLDQYPAVTLRTEETYDEKIPKGVILGQSVQVGEELPQDGVVVLTVSLGPQYVIMPRLEGCTLDAAQYMLSSLGLTWDPEIREDSTLNVPVGTVVCDTAQGSKVTAGYQVTLTVKVEGSSEATDPGEESSRNE